MTKTYKCRLSMLGLLVDVNGEKKRVDFHQSTINAAGIIGCVYTTDNEEIQKAIESLDRFNNGYKNQIWLDNVVEDEPKEEETAEAEPVVEVKKVARRKKK